MQAAVLGSAYRRRRRPRRRRRRRRQHVLVHPGRHRGVDRRRSSSSRGRGRLLARTASSSSPAACRPATAPTSPRRCPRSTRSCPSPRRTRCSRSSSGSRACRAAPRDASDRCPRAAERPAAHRARPLGVPAGLRRLPPELLVLHDPDDPRPVPRRPLDRDRRRGASSSCAGGAREIVLVGQDISSYGRDLHRSRRLGHARGRRARGRARRRPRSGCGSCTCSPTASRDELLEVMADGTHRLPLPRHAAPACLGARAASGCGGSGSATEFLRAHRRIRDGDARRRAAHEPHRRLPGRDARTTSRARGVPSRPRASTTRACSPTLQRTARRRRRCPTCPTTQHAAPARATVCARRRDRIGFEKAANRVGEVLDVLVEGVRRGRRARRPLARPGAGGRRRS